MVKCGMLCDCPSQNASISRLGFLDDDEFSIPNSSHKLREGGRCWNGCKWLLFVFSLKRTECEELY